MKLFLLLTVLLSITLLLSAEPKRFAVVSGYLSMTDSEVDEGYFGIGQKSMIRLEPHTMGWVRLQELKGKVVTIWVEVEE